jgi:choline dehydrogenase-like flavoprotein
MTRPPGGSGTRHGATTTRSPLGLDPDAGAVVEPDARVYGVTGLSVVDASILPEITSANTNISTIMAAEHAAMRRMSPWRACHVAAGVQ